MDSVRDQPVRRRPKDWALIVGAERHAWLGDADYARREILAALETVRDRASPEARVWFYYAGHGGTDENSGISYLAPWDADPRYWSKTTVPLAELFGELEKIDAQVVAVLDTSFSGDGGRTWDEAPLSPAFKEVRPSAPKSQRLTVLYAALPGETAATLDDQGHGLMTYALLRGLRGEASSGRHLDLDGLARFVHREVRRRAKDLGRVQTPRLEEGVGETDLW